MDIVIFRLSVFSWPINIICTLVPRHSMFFLNYIIYKTTNMKWQGRNFIEDIFYLNCAVFTHYFTGWEYYTPDGK